MQAFSIFFVIAVIVHGALQLWLAERHARHVRAHRDGVPVEFRAAIPLEAHRKAADYTVARVRFGQFDLLLGLVFLMLWTLGGGLNWLDWQLRAIGLAPLWHGVLFLIVATLIMGLLDLPTSLYRTFFIEQSFGFNRTTPRTFVLDLVKESTLLLVLGAPLAAIVLWLMAYAGALWWLWVWVVWMSFSVLMLWAYPRFIAPLFNSFRPLESGDLQRRIETLLSRTGFTADGLFVMDGSRRSSHGNAYFTGFGRNKRIVFFDTLLAELAPDEIESVLAHELGHFRRHHVYKMLAVTAALSLVALALLGWVSEQGWFYHGLGVETPSTHTALMLFMLVIPVFSVALQPALAALSRKHEFEADRYAAEQADAASLMRALVKLYRDNAATLTPDPLYSAFHDSHPPAPLRIAHLRSLAGSSA